MNTIPDPRELKNPISDFNLMIIAEMIVKNHKINQPLNIQGTLDNSEEVRKEQISELTDLFRKAGWKLILEKVPNDKKVSSERKKSNKGWYDPQEDAHPSKEYREEIERKSKLSNEEIATEFDLFDEVLRIYPTFPE